ncbi:MAG TPA: hypothetical protein VFB80_03645, partial [Pirellulaceae bacterium]|nr:hypothetical protein [Pirellulaceae bacterium]
MPTLSELPPHYRLIVVLSPIWLLNWLILAAVDPDGPGSGRGWEYVILGNLIGSMFAHGTLAAAWCAWGPGWLAARLPLSLAWIAASLGAVAINIGINGGPGDAVPILAACMVAQWLLVQVPLWCIALGYGLQIRATDSRYSTPSRQDLQFGIRQLMILTAIVAVMLGLARFLVMWLGARWSNWGGDTVAFIFLAAAAVIMTLPLLLAALLPRRALPATLVVLLLIAGATAAESPLFHRLPQAGGG